MKDILKDVDQREAAIVNTHAAFRWKPEPQQIVRHYRKSGSKAEKSASGSGSKASSSRSAIWIPEGSQVRPVYVSRGLTDGSLTEVSSPELKEGMPIVVGEAEKTASATSAGGSPFTPKFFRRSSNSK